MKGYLKKISQSISFQRPGLHPRPDGAQAARFDDDDDHTDDETGQQQQPLTRRRGRPPGSRGRGRGKAARGGRGRGRGTTPTKSRSGSQTAEVGESSGSGANQPANTPKVRTRSFRKSVPVPVVFEISDEARQVIPPPTPRDIQLLEEANRDLRRRIRHNALLAVS